MSHIDQYLQRENIVISGIPDRVSHEELDGKMIDLIISIDDDLEPSDIVACHRLAKINNDPSKVIIRFANRKKVSSSLKINLVRCTKS